METRIGTHLLIRTPVEPFRAYLPPSLPPTPPIQIAGILMLLDKANQAIGRLDGISHLLPNIPLFLYMYIRKEAVMSSQIEGTQSSLSDLLIYENEAAPGAPAYDDVEEVSSYVAAMDHGLARLQEGFPLSLRLIREMHGILLSKGRGMYQTPGEFRSSQNWIGGTRPGNAVYVPPPPDLLMGFLDQFEKFLHADGLELPILVKAAVAHLQFESIHPFLDGNGRLGRLLVTLMLCAGSVLTQPMLYLSLYLKRHRQRYYDLLQSVRLTGNWRCGSNSSSTGWWKLPTRQRMRPSVYLQSSLKIAPESKHSAERPVRLSACTDTCRKALYFRFLAPRNSWRFRFRQRRNRWTTCCKPGY